jgi:NhaA family Na+:H+ antiporter
MQWLGFRGIFPYVVVGAGVWVALAASGIHPTLAGVALGLLTPARGLSRRVPIDVVSDLYGRLLGQEGSSRGAPEPVSPLDRLSQALHPWAAFAVMPLFALANAGVAVRPDLLTTPVALGTALALLLGKPLGIISFSWLAVRLGLARLPEGVNWPAVTGAGCLGGIGFTMSLFIAGLAFSTQPDLHYAAKIGILIGSVTSGCLGYLFLLASLPRADAASAETEERGVTVNLRQ